MQIEQSNIRIRTKWRSLLTAWSNYDGWRQQYHTPTALQRYFFAAFSVVAISGLHVIFGSKLGDRSPFLFYIMAVTASAWYGSISAGLLSLFLSIFAATGPFKSGDTLPLQIIIFSVESTVITILIASLRYTRSLSQERASQLQQNSDQMRALVDGISDYAIYLVDMKGYILSWSDAAAEIQGYREHEVIGRKFSMFYLPEELITGKPEHDLLIATQQGRQEEEGWVSRKDGTTFWANKVITSLPNSNGGVRGFAHVTRDMTERKQAEDLIHHQAHHDGLTGLPNRLYLQENLTSLLKWAGRRSELIGIMFLDLDRFKAINDSLGHQIGDMLLKEVANRLVGVVGRQDMVARLGSDEFVLVMNGVRGSSELARLGNEVVNALHRPLELEGHQLYIQASIGASLYPQDGETAASLIQNADIALYHSKQTKAVERDSVTLYSKNMNANASARLSLESELRQAVGSNQFQIYFQPIFSISKGTTLAAEALIRWQHPTLGLISPGDFIPLAEETGLIIELGNQVVEAVCRQQAEWERAGLTIVPIAVNLSARQFAQNNLHLQIENRLRQYHLDPKALTIEITETVAMQDINSAVHKLNQIAEIGVDCAIDDFGIGFSSLNYLKRLPIAKVKIDKSFIDHCVNDPKDGAIIKAIISMAHTLKLKVVAEGIEENSQLQLLRTAHCDFGQGYLVSRPEPANLFSTRLANASITK